MTQDWSATLTPECFGIGTDICVYCQSRGDVSKLEQFLQEAGVTAEPCWLLHDGNIRLSWSASNPCYRFTRSGHLASGGSINCYEQDPRFKVLPKFTFYPEATALPELDTASSVPLMF